MTPDNQTPQDGDIPHELIARFQRLFQSDAPTHGRFRARQTDPSGKVQGRSTTYKGVPGPIQFAEHLRGTHDGLGVVPVQCDGTAMFGAIDYDDRSLDHVALARQIHDCGLPLVLCRSKSGGAHLYAFLAKAIPASSLRRQLRDWATKLSLPPKTEIFPKQDHLSDQGSANWINLPYFRAHDSDRRALIDERWSSLESFVQYAEALVISPVSLERESAADKRPALSASLGSLVSEGGRNVALNKELFLLRKQGADDDSISATAAELNQQQCDPPLPSDEISDIVKSVLKVRPDDLVDDLVERLNPNFALCLMGGRAQILWFRSDGTFDTMTRDAFIHFLANRPVFVGDRQRSIAHVWLQHPKRRTYRGLVFEPAGTRTAGAYNLFQGWAVERRPGKVSLFLDHILANVARGNPEHAAWIVAWMADIVQRPEQKKGTALVLVGPQGSGKTIVGAVLGKLLGPHYLLASQDSHITGKFNSHHQGLLLLHSDEALFAGDHAAAGKLKDFVTSREQLIEKKGLDVIRVANHARLLVTSEQQWVVPASLRERRFAVFEMATTHVQDHAYFGALMKELEQGGYEALLDYLLTLEYDEELLRTIPHTAALTEQKLFTMRPEEAWMLDLLNNGVLPGAGEEANECQSSRLYESYIRHTRNRGVRIKHAETLVGRYLVKAFARKIRREQREVHGQRVMMRIFPPLGECRALFSDAMRHHGQWPEPQDWMPDSSASTTRDGPDR